MAGRQPQRHIRIVGAETLNVVGLSSIELDYKISKKTDEFGNAFRYRAKVTDLHGSQMGRWALDVFLVSTP